MRKYKLYKKIKLSKASRLTCAAAAIVALFAVSYNTGERYYVKNNPEEPEKTVFKVSLPTQADYKDEIVIYDTMHRMANSKVVVKDDDKSGSLKITSQQTQAIRTIVETMNYPDKSYIFAVLNRWEKGDFAFIEDEHDYFWTRFKGIAGETD